MEKEKVLVQTVYITLSDGRIGAFSGPALALEDDKDKTITDIKFTRPRELPSDYSFENIKNEDISNNI